MQDETPSFTARWVAMGRSLGVLLPPTAQLIDDRYGVRVTSRPLARLIELGRHTPTLRPLLRLALWPLVSGSTAMQVRTRVIDDELADFWKQHPDGQLLLLGAGFDARALRLDGPSGQPAVFEVDHPATQKLKRERFAGSPAVYVAWNFEVDPMADLPARLAQAGHDRGRPTFTIWEGVTMYLSESAIHATAAAVRSYSAVGSRLCFTYVERAALSGRSLRLRLASALVRRVGEPFRFGWPPEELAEWWRARNFRLLSDVDLDEAAHRLLPPRWARAALGRYRHVAVVEPLAPNSEAS